MGGCRDSRADCPRDVRRVPFAAPCLGKRARDRSPSLATARANLIGKVVDIASLLGPRTYCIRVMSVEFVGILFQLQREVPGGGVLAKKPARVP